MVSRKSIDHNKWCPCQSSCRFSADVAVQQLPGRGQKVIGDMRKHSLCKLHRVTLCGCFERSWGITEISQARAHRTPAVFESNEPGVVQIRATQVKFEESLLLGLLNCLPE